MKVLFVCSGGMSSTIAVNALKKEAAKHGEDEPMAYSPLGGPKLYTQMKGLTGGN